MEFQICSFSDIQKYQISIKKLILNCFINICDTEEQKVYLTNYINKFFNLEGISWICKFENRIIGIITFKPNTKYNVANFAVDTKFQNQNIGKTLLKKLIEYAKNNNIRNLSLITNELFKSAIHLYEKFSFSKEYVGNNKYAVSINARNIYYTLNI